MDEIPISTPLTCVETGLPSMLIIGQVYIVVKFFPNSSHRGPIVQLDNGVTTYASKFVRAT